MVIFLCNVCTPNFWEALWALYILDVILGLKCLGWDMSVCFYEGKLFGNQMTAHSHLLREHEQEFFNRKDSISTLVWLMKSALSWDITRLFPCFPDGILYKSRQPESQKRAPCVGFLFREWATLNLNMENFSHSPRSGWPWWRPQTETCWPNKVVLMNYRCCWSFVTSSRLFILHAPS